MLLSRPFLAFIAGLLAGVVAFADEKPPEPGQVRHVHTLLEHGGRVGSLSFSADGSRLLSSGGQTVRLWDPATGKQLSQFVHKGEHAGPATLSPDGRTVVACFGSGREILLLDAASGKVLRRLTQPAGVYKSAFTPDGKWLISAGYSPDVRLWDVATGKEGPPIRLRDPATGKELDPKRLRQNQFEDCWGVAFSPDGKTVAVGVSDGSIRLCDPATGAETRRLFHEDDNNREIYQLAFSPDGRFLAAAGIGFKVTARLWDVATAKAVREFRLPPIPLPVLPGEVLPGHQPPPAPQGAFTLAFSPDGKTLATSWYRADRANMTCLWEVATGRVRHHFPFSAFSLAFSPAGPLAAGHEDGVVKLWDWRDPCLERPKRLDPGDIDRLWADLAGEDAAAAYRGIATLASLPARSVEVLSQRLQPVEPVAAAQLERLIADLDSEVFAIREQAQERLTGIGEAARLALQQALTKQQSPEVQARVMKLLAQLEKPLSPQQLRTLRAVEALEHIGTAQARQVLQKLADGAPRALETEDARAALQRLARK